MRKTSHVMHKFASLKLSNFLLTSFFVASRTRLLSWPRELFILALRFFSINGLFAWKKRKNTVSNFMKDNCNELVGRIGNLKWLFLCPKVADSQILNLALWAGAGRGNSQKFWIIHCKSYSDQGPRHYLKRTSSLSICHLRALSLILKTAGEAASTEKP